MSAKRRHRAVQQAAGTKVGHEGDEISPVGIKEVEQRRVVLAAAFLLVVTDSFQRQHRADVVAALARHLRIDAAAHLRRLKERRLFVHERHKADRPLRLQSRQAPGDFQQRGDAAAVVIGAGTADDRIVVRADKDDLGRLLFAAPCDFQISHLNVRNPVRMPRNPVTLFVPHLFDVIGGALKRSLHKHIALADVSGQLLHVIFELFG